jgi:hypothetical protein
MNYITYVISEDGAKKPIKKVDQMCEGCLMSLDSLNRFNMENTRFDTKYQFIELNSYGKALFDSYKSVSDPKYSLKEYKFVASGVTNLGAALNTSVKYLTTKELGHYNRNVNIIIISDGVPTDVNGYPLSETEMKRQVDMFYEYLEKHNLTQYVAVYFIAIGDEAEMLGRYIAGDDRFFKVEDCEHIGEKINFVTLQSLADCTTVTGDAIGYGKMCYDDDDSDSGIDDDDDDDDDNDDNDSGIDDDGDDGDSGIDGDGDDGDDGDSDNGDNGDNNDNNDNDDSGDGDNGDNGGNGGNGDDDGGNLDDILDF